MTLAVWAVAALVGGAIGLEAAVNETDSDVDVRPRNLAVSAVRDALGVSPDQFLRALRREDHDEPFQPEWIATNGLQAFEVVDRGVDFGPNGRLMVHSSTNRTAVLVLVNARTGQSYLLRGSPDPVKGFSSLVKDCDIRIASPESALTLFRIYAEIGGGFTDRLVTSPEAAANKIEAYFLSRFGESRLSQSLSRWLKSNRGKLRHVLPPRAASRHGGFEVTFYSVENGMVLQRRMVIEDHRSVRIADEVPITSAIVELGAARQDKDR